MDVQEERKDEIVCERKFPEVDLISKMTLDGSDAYLDSSLLEEKGERDVKVKCFEE